MENNVEGSLKEDEVIPLGGKSKTLPAGTAVVVDKTSKTIISFEGNREGVIAKGTVVAINGVSVTLDVTCASNHR